MRPLRLEVGGFTSFAEKQVVDFSGLDLFAITGPTGAGKSSLIDALVFALYGQVPRVGDMVGIKGITLQVEAVAHNSATSVRITLPEQSPNTSEGVH